MFTVNEDNWFPCFKKNHWYDMRTDARSALQNPIPGIAEPPEVYWSVDNEAIWNCMRPGIELANRILGQLMFDQSEWLDAFLFPPY
ncbi:hypothetical protein F5B20DRAFT_518600, partial [Whalleya microplaca]